ncbi:MAG: Sua5/YciO/YrdC/YwlC family protein, partial [Elusimicrobiota bacterium]|nr:Sua5/YciO/YrdC/YwlC family protein [Elusimicrobiota bacterium]
MKAKSLKISAIDKTASKKVAQMVKNGGVAVVPTETVYGFAADVFNLSAKKRIFSLKGRNYKKPLIAMAYDLESLKILVNISKEALKLAQTFWPGRLTLILNTTNIGKIVSGGRADIGVR